MGSIDGAVKETLHCLDVLKHDGVSLFASYGEQFLGDPFFDPLMQALDALNDRALRLLGDVGLREMAGLTAVPLWRWALFAYVSLSVGGSMHLSASDVRGTWRGVVTLGIWLGALVLLSLVLWWVLSQIAPTVWPTLWPAVWPTHVAPMLHQAAAGLARASDALARALQLSVAVNVAGAVLLFVVRRLVRVAR